MMRADFPARVLLRRIRQQYRGVFWYSGRMPESLGFSRAEIGRIRTPFFERCGTATAKQGGDDAAHWEAWRMAVAALAARHLVHAPQGREAYRHHSEGQS